MTKTVEVLRTTEARQRGAFRYVANNTASFLCGAEDGVILSITVSQMRKKLDQDKNAFLGCVPDDSMLAAIEHGVFMAKQASFNKSEIKFLRKRRNEGLTDLEVRGLRVLEGDFE